MKKSVLLRSAIGLTVLILALAGCSPSGSSQEGIEIMFENNPRIYKQEVYDFGQIIGQVIDQKAGSGAVYKVTVRLAPEASQEAGRHWVFYVENGRLNASRIYGSGQLLTPGDKICGFSSKAALNWFKIKTLLTNRVYKATQIAESLSRRFG